MLAKINRFSFKKGIPRKIYSTPLFVIRYDKNELNKLECAVVIGKKVDKKAVVRNKIKRGIVNIIKNNVPLDANFKIVIYGRKDIKDKTLQETEEELIKTLKTIKII